MTLNIVACLTGSACGVTLPHVGVIIVKTESGGYYTLYAHLRDESGDVYSVADRIRSGLNLHGAPFGSFDEAMEDAKNDLQILSERAVQTWGPTISPDVYETALSLSKREEIDGIPDGLLAAFAQPMNLELAH